MADKKKGKLIVFEGIDGCGKSTQVKMLSDYLTSKGIKNVVSAEPTHGKFGTAVREAAARGERMCPKDEMAYLLNDRAEHVTTFIRPELEEGTWVILDRYYLSMLAYQGKLDLSMQDVGELFSGCEGAYTYGIAKKTPLSSVLLNRGMVCDFLYSLNRQFAPMYDACFYIDVPVDTAVQRIKRRGKPDAFERRSQLESCKDSFDYMSNMMLCKRIDGSGTAEEVHQRVLAAMDNVFNGESDNNLLHHFWE